MNLYIPLQLTILSSIMFLLTLLELKKVCVRNPLSIGLLLLSLYYRLYKILDLNILISEEHILFCLKLILN